MSPVKLIKTISGTRFALSCLSIQTFVQKPVPGKIRSTDYLLGSNWHTDRGDKELFDGILQGAKTVSKWRNDVLLDWAKRWEWLY